MNVNTELLELFSRTETNDQSALKAAENALLERRTRPGFVTDTLAICTYASATLHSRLTAAIFLKNHIRNNWEQGELEIPETEKEVIREHIFTVLLSLVDIPMLTKLLTSALIAIALTDFPSKWPQLLPQITSVISAEATTPIQLKCGLHVLSKVLDVCKSMSESKEADNFLRYVLELVFKPLLELFQRVCRFFANNTQCTVIECENTFSLIRHISNVFYCLNVITIPQQFEDSLAVWFDGFRKALLFDASKYGPEVEQLLLCPNNTDAAGLLHKVQASIARNLCLYAERYDTEFEEFLKVFVGDVWNLLLKVNNQPKYDRVIAHYVRFLRCVSVSIHHNLFANADVMKSVIVQVIIPQMVVRENDIEMFEDNPHEYITQDMDGVSLDTRRHAVTELVRGLRKNYETQITQLCSQDVNSMISQYIANPKENWKAKDCAIYLITALAVKGVTSSQGSSETNSLVPIIDFYKSQIFPELEAPNAVPLLKADCLKFVTIFRTVLVNCLSPDEILQLFRILTSLLRHPSVVIHSYSSVALERLMTLTKNDKPVFDKPFIQSVSSPIIESVVVMTTQITNVNSSAAAEQQNEYLMKTLYKVLMLLGNNAYEYATVLFPKLATVLRNVSQNPSNPLYNHFLFETICILTRTSLNVNSECLPAIEQLFLPLFQEIFVKDITDFIPYVCQLLCVIVERTKIPPNSVYLSGFLSGLLEPSHSTGIGRGTITLNIARYAQSCVENSAVGCIPLCEKLFAFVQKLLKVTFTEVPGMSLAQSIFTFIPVENLQPYLKGTFTLILTRLMEKDSPRLRKAFVLFFSQFVVTHGIDTALSATDSVQNGLSTQVLEILWLGQLSSLTTQPQKRLGVIALVKTFTHLPFLNGPNARTWPQLVLKAYNLIVQSKPEEEVPLSFNVANNGNGFAANDNDAVQVSSARLQASTTSPREYYPELGQIEEYFSFELHNVLSARKDLTNEVRGLLGEQGCTLCSQWGRARGIPQHAISL